MKTNKAAKLFEALSSEVRLDIFRLLVKYAPEGLVAGEIAQTLNIPASNLSFHLKSILHSGLISVEKKGRYLRYKANIPLMLQIVGFLTEECCAGNPDKCLQYRADSKLGKGILAEQKQK